MYESYRSFASVYDEFMDGTDYQKTADQIQDMITRFGVSKPSQKRTGASEAPLDSALPDEPEEDDDEEFELDE